MRALFIKMHRYILRFGQAGLAVFLACLLVAQPLSAYPLHATATPAFAVRLPEALGQITESYAPSKSLHDANHGSTLLAQSPSTRPDFIFIQDLHVNRSVQFAISGILKQLKNQDLVPEVIAVEGETGPVDIQPMQRHPDPAERKAAADYLVEQGEMPGAMHFAVTEGEGRLFGIETEDYYRANLDMFRRSYEGWPLLRQEIGKLQAALPKLRTDPATRDAAAVLEKDVAAVNQLLRNQVTPDELPAILAGAASGAEHLRAVLPGSAGGNLFESLTASVNFYSLALLRNEELFKNSLAVREPGRQNTTLVITGGFHTEALTEQCKRSGLSYIVITPNIKRHSKVDERLYVERLLDYHLTPEQIETGLDWAAMTMIQPRSRTLPLWSAAVSATAPQAAVSDRPGLRRRNWFRKAVAVGAIAVICAGSASCGGNGSPTAPTKPEPPVVEPLPPPIGTVIATKPQQHGEVTLIGLPIHYIAFLNVPLNTFSEGMKLRLVFPKDQAGIKFRVRLLIPDQPGPQQGLNPFIFEIPPDGIVDFQVRAADYGLDGGWGLGFVRQFSVRSGDADPLRPEVPLNEFPKRYAVFSRLEDTTALFARLWEILPKELQKTLKFPARTAGDETGNVNTGILLAAVTAIGAALGLALLGHELGFSAAWGHLQAYLGLGALADVAGHAGSAILSAWAALSASLQDQAAMLQHLRTVLPDLRLRPSGSTAAIFAIPAGIVMGVLLRRKLKEQNEMLRHRAAIARAA